ncbi:MAG: hypothetical protein P4L86_32345 [Mycobacterium sp.]|nr:hypothetical protein [Mycobacterium sp.]
MVVDVVVDVVVDMVAVGWAPLDVLGVVTAALEPLPASVVAGWPAGSVPPWPVPGSVSGVWVGVPVPVVGDVPLGVAEVGSAAGPEPVVGAAVGSVFAGAPAVAPVGVAAEPLCGDDVVAGA